MAEPPLQVKELIDRFDQNFEAYHSPGYNETQVRLEFINPLFEILGWDVANKSGYAEAYKDVIHEDAIKVGGATKAPDYSFRVGGARKFFLEAKKPAISIKDETSPSYQLRRYAWSAKLPLSILTNFAEIAIYDCRLPPKESDKASVGRVLYLTYKDYPADWDKIASIFSKEAVLQGSFDKFAEAGKGKKGTSQVDEEFLTEIEGWRDALAKNLALRNPKLSVRDLNFAVQRTIDRIIFLRMCEDRGVEQYGQLQALLNGENTYKRLQYHYGLADDRYNSGLFHFRPEKGRAEAPDELTLKLKIDDKVLKDIIRRLYYPDSPYEFSVLGADILGNVYEQFLGKVIRLTAGHHAVVEDKPEVKKAGGVYYTPAYIVDYIVKNTVDKLCEGKSPKQIEKLKILDPACGSGSFLIGAYTYLLNYHREWYVKDGLQKHTKEIYQGSGGQWLLTTQEKKRILLNNIYGVDIDSQAVEVTKLSLLLKVLEGESEETIGKSLKLFRERALPDLGDNIKCGNSLIGPDFYKDQQISFLDDEERYRINVFDWNAEFPEIMKSAGFDAVIGNPPYIFTRNQGIDKLQKEYFYDHYEHQSSQLNTFGIFVERCHELIRKSGVLGFITPNNWLTIDTFALLRKFVLEVTKGVKIVNILDRVFAAANVDTAITLFEKGEPSSLTISEMTGGKEVFSSQVKLSAIKTPAYIIQISLLKDSRNLQLVKRIESCSQPLAKFCTVSTGLKAYQTGKGDPPQSDYEKKNRVFHHTSKRNRTYERYLDGVDVRRYHIGWSGEYLSYGDWLAEPRKSVPFVGERLLVRQIPSRPPYLVHGAFTDEPFYNDINSMIIFGPVAGISLKYLSGLINSRLLSMWFLKTFDKLQRKIFPQFKVKELASFPIYPINFSDPTDKGWHDKMVKLVERMLGLHKHLGAVKNPNDKTKIQREIEATNREIDQLVYELYGLTEEEIKIVEANNGSK